MPTTKIKPLLTIGVVVWNKEPYLKILLEQIIAQMTPKLQKEVEVVISDNASTDNTEQVMKNYLKKELPYLRYNRNKKNLGISGNILKQIELARGKYLWFIGDDEILKNGIAKLLSIIKQHEKEKCIFLMSIPNIFEKKVWISDLNKDPKFILNNSANMTTTIMPVEAARKIVSEIKNVNKVWPHNHIDLLISLKLNYKWVLIHNNIFKYMTHFPKKSEPRGLGHANNLESYFDMIVSVDKQTGGNLFGKINKSLHFLILFPFLDTLNPEKNKLLRKKIKEMRNKYDIKILASLCLLLLSIPSSIRRMLFDLGGRVFYGKRYANYSKNTS